MAITKGGLTLIQQLQKLFGARNVSDMMGRTTNVQTLAQGTNNPFRNTFSKKYLQKNPDGVEEASKVIMENMQFAFGNKNAKQMKNFKNNVDTLFEIKFPPTASTKGEAQILDLSTKKQVTGKGIDSLKDKMGLPKGVSPDSPLGKILTSQNRMNKMSQELSDLGAKTYSAPEEGRRRAVMRQILLRDRRINLPENIRDSLDNFKDLQRGGDKSMDPLTLFTKYYKRDNAKLDKLDEISGESKDAIDAADNFLVKDDTIELLDKKPMVRESLDDEAVEMAEQSDLDDDIPFAQGGIAGQLHLNEGGRVGLKKGGGMDRRTFLKLMGGLASLPIVGKLFKGAKVASKVVPLKNTTTTMPAWFPDFVDKFVAKGVGKKVDQDIMEYTVKELPDVKLLKQDNGAIRVEGKNAYSEEYYIDYEPPGVEIVDFDTGKTVKTKGDFVATDTEYRMISPEDYDIDGVNVNDIDELLGGSSNQLEGFAKGTGKTKNTIGQRRIDEASARGADKDESLRADINDPYGDIDPTDFVEPEDFAKGGLAGQLL